MTLKQKIKEISERSHNRDVDFLLLRIIDCDRQIKEMKRKIKVLVIDDSALVREILKSGLSSDPRFEVVGTAPNAYIARDEIVLKKPDVLTLDIQMPKMDGIDFLKRLMPQYPLPIVIVSAMAEPGAKATLQALDYGAVDFVLKPSTRTGNGLSEMIRELAAKIQMASEVDVSKWKIQRPSEPSRRTTNYNTAHIR